MCLIRCVVSSYAVPANELNQIVGSPIRKKVSSNMKMAPWRCVWTPSRAGALVIPVATFILPCTCRRKLKQPSHVQPRYGYNTFFFSNQTTKQPSFYSIIYKILFFFSLLSLFFCFYLLYSLLMIKNTYCYDSLQLFFKSHPPKI